MWHSHKNALKWYIIIINLLTKKNAIEIKYLAVDVGFKFCTKRLALERVTL